METFDAREIVVIFGVSVGLLLIASRLHLPSIVAFILTGMLVGPFGLKLVSMDRVEALATVGIVLLLFTIGMECSIGSLRSMSRLFFIGGPFQVFVTLVCGFFIALVIGRPIGESVFFGCILSLSSTAIVLKSLDQRKEANAPHGKYVISIAIFQDVITVPMLLITPLLAGETVGGKASYIFLIVKGVLIVALVYFLAIKVIPKLMYRITRTKKRELFLLTILTICFSVAWFTHLLGLPLSLGAFLAGLTVSESEYRHQAIGDILPFQDIFTCFFFVSIGMLLDIDFVLAQPFLIAFLTVAVMILKASIASIGALLLKYPLRSALIGGLFLCQVGEFSFVVAQAGRPYALGTEYLFQIFLAISLFTMALSPYLILFSSKISLWLSQAPVPDRIRFGLMPKAPNPTEVIQNHVVVLGYGICGRMLGSSCVAANIPFVAIELNPQIVHQEREKGVPIFFGDATNEVVLRHAHIEHAKVVVVCVNDPTSVRRTIEQVKNLNPHSYILVRSKYMHEISYMVLLGANEVVADEFETSVEIFTRVLRKYLIPKDEIHALIGDIRAKGYEQVRTSTVESGSRLVDIEVQKRNISIETVRVASDAKIVGMKVEETGLRKIYGVTILLIRRGETTITDVRSDFVIEASDVLVLYGDHQGIIQAHLMFQSRAGG